ncbi:hypothetical protein ANCCAN_24064 [Ancylostoma caninum]|uniref:Uncharacterized protein n=1 Tax=Ancylostoma caninum TaxID=29170 RepID=A0A368FJ21_ANCCA|nr:hypothetical protein ANCCAN_24064 [Ancylostoma caninum]
MSSQKVGRELLYFSLKHVKIYYCLVALATLLAIIGTTSVFFSRIEALHYYAMAMTVGATAPTVFCYLAVKRYFKDVPSSNHVKRMQTKFSHGFLVQVSLEISTYANKGRTPGIQPTITIRAPPLASAYLESFFVICCEALKDKL